MFYIVLASLIAIAIVIALLVGFFGPKGTPEKRDSYGYRTSRGTPDTRKAGKIAAAGLTALLLLLTLAFAATTVSARHVGVETAFGKYRGSLDAGFHFTAPWSSVEEFPTLVQPMDVVDVPVAFDGVESVNPETGEVETSGSGGTGTANTYARWQVTSDNIKTLWEKYRSFDRVQNELVYPTIKESTAVQVGKFSPVEAIAAENRRPINEAIDTDLDDVLGSNGIVVDSVSVTAIVPGPQAQAAIDRVVDINGKIEAARGEEERAIIDARTLATRKAAGANEPDALARYCLDVTNAWDVNKNGPLPATWSCVAPSGGVQPVLPVK